MATLIQARIPNTPLKYDPRHIEALSRSLNLMFRRLDSDSYRLGASETVATATTAGVKGEIKYDDDYVYICVDTDTWKRTALSTF